jgi:Flp pilus assembly pilin Flp
MKKIMKKLVRDQKGVTIPEYALALALVAVAVIIAAPTITQGVTDIFNGISTYLSTSAAGLP